MICWWITASTTLLTVLGYVAFFWKINWVKDVEDSRNSRGRRISKSRKIGQLPPVYPNGWFALLESWELGKAEVKHVAALGENFAVFRTNRGQVKILDAYCPHLGANMGEGGTVKGDCLECPFHSWQFRGDDGQCQSIPYAKNVPQFAKTRAWKCCEVNQIIFVWYHAELEEPSWQLPSVEPITTGAWWNHGRNEFRIEAHIQEIPENGADWAHLNAVHGSGMFLTNIFPGFLRHSWTGAVWNARTSKSTEDEKSDEENGEKMNRKDDWYRATLKLSHNLILFERFSFMRLDVTAEQIGPGYVQLNIETSMGMMCILQTVTPLEPLLQRVTHIIFSSPLLGPYTRIVMLAECVMFERDIAIWNHKRYEKRPMIVREDRSIIAYRRWYEQFYTSTSPTYDSVKSLDW